MCKIKDQLLQLKEDEFEFNLSYQEWLKDNEKELSENDLNKMEEDFLKPSTTGNLILSKEALNNIDFNPKLGA